MLKGEMKKLWEEVKANHRALEGCVGPHDFVADAEAALAGEVYLSRSF